MFYENEDVTVVQKTVIKFYLDWCYPYLSKAYPDDIMRIVVTLNKYITACREILKEDPKDEECITLIKRMKEYHKKCMDIYDIVKL